MTPVAPMLVFTSVSYANNWYNTKRVTDVKPLVFGGIATILLCGLGAIPGMEKTATLIGWTALAGMLIAPIQKPSPVQNLLRITSQANPVKPVRKG